MTIKPVRKRGLLARLRWLALRRKHTPQVIDEVHTLKDDTIYNAIMQGTAQSKKLPSIDEEEAET